MMYATDFLEDLLIPAGCGSHGAQTSSASGTLATVERSA
jgi:hypothetical protein